MLRTVSRRPAALGGRRVRYHAPGSSVCAAPRPGSRTKPGAAAPRLTLESYQYGVLAVVLALAGAAAYVAPQTYVSGLVGVSGAPAFLAEDTLRSTAAYAPVAAAAAGVLAAAARDEARRASATYERLELALFLTAGGGLVATRLAWGEGAVTSPLLVATVCAAFPLLGLTAFALGRRGCSVASLLSGTAADLVASLAFLRQPTLLGKYLMSNVPLSIVVGGSFLFSPMSPLAFPAAVLAEETPAFRLLRALFGLDTLFLLAPVYFVLADAQARSNLGAPCYRALLLSCGLCTLLIDAATFKLVFELEAAVSPAAAGASLSGEQAPTLVSALSLAAGQSAAFFVQALKPSSGVEEEEVVTR